MIDPGFSHIDDEAVPAVPLLLGPDAAGLLEAVVAAGSGQIKSHRISQIRYEPGSSIVVRYQADVRWDDGRSTRESLIAASGIKVPDGVPFLEADGVAVAVWRYPVDPFLPGLAAAANPAQARQLLAQLGVEAPKARLRLRAYRPGRRAVIEVNTPRARIFLKVVRPSRVADLQKKHIALAEAVPVPHSHGWSEETGIVALQAMPGKPLRKVLESGTRRLPEAQRLMALLDAFPEPTAADKRVSGPEERATRHGRLLKVVTPELSDRIDALVESMAGLAAEAPVAVHGDFHSSQILVRGQDVVGLIDVDTAGSGQRINDLAVFLAHVSAVGLSTAARRTIDRYGRQLIASFDRAHDPRSLRLKVAGAIVGFATGPFRVNQARWREQTERRIALAERWVESAGQV